MNILVYAQSVDGNIPGSNLTCIQAALELKASLGASKVIGLVIGSSSEANQIANFGLDEVVFVNNSDKYTAPDYAAIVVEAISQTSSCVFVTTASSLGKDLSPRVSVKFNAGQASDIIGVEPNSVLVRPMYAGDVIAKVQVETANKVITVRSSSFSAPASTGAASSIRELSVNITKSNLAEVVSVDTVKGERPELGDAKTVVSGGRALQSAENFEKYIYPLADAFGAAIGASRAAVDSGYAPNDWQVGQTGKIVAPNLYVAVGISGAIQHLAGMKDSKTIVAINKDAEAPIYEVADYGLVADLFTAVPELTDAVNKAKS
jgi:electron transfer flavoprotein alpha subunit